MKKILPIIIAVVTGLTVLTGYFFQDALSPVLRVIFDWFVLILGSASLIGIAALLRLHFNKILSSQKSAFYSFILILVFLLTLIAGFVLTFESDLFQELILTVEIPVEASFLAIMAATLLYTSLRFIRTKGWTPMSIGFLGSAIASLIFNLGYLQAQPGTIGAALLLFFKRLPVVGARGILLGMAIGGLVMGLRLLTTMDRPYGE